MPVDPVGVPARVDVPLPLSTKVTPVGKLPVSVIVGVGHVPAPVVTVIEFDVPVVKTVEAALEIDGVWLTTRVNDIVAAVPTPFVARTRTEYVPPVPVAGVPESTPAEESVTPDGSAPVSEKVALG
jgi:hypothetical protein